MREIGRVHNSHVICFDADKVAGRRHVSVALDHAVRSFAEGTAISKTLEMEALLYAAGSRQCNIGSSFGIHEGMNRLYICCHPSHCTSMVIAELASSMTFVQDDSWDAIGPAKQKLLAQVFDISNDELKTMEDPNRFIDLVLERVTLLDVLR